MNVHPEVQALFAAHETFERELRKRRDKPSIEVSRAVSFMAFTFERIRNSIDYRDDHILRRASIARSLTRKFTIQENSRTQADKLLQELVLARYAPAEHVPQDLVGEVAQVLDKYKKVLTGTNSQVRNWLAKIAAVEADRILFPPYRQDALTNLLFSCLASSIRLPREQDQARQDRLVYVTAARAAVGADSSLISFLLLNSYLPGWLKNNEKTISEFRKNLPALYHSIQTDVNHSSKEPLLRFFSRRKAPILLLQDLAANHTLEELKEMTDQELDEELDNAYRKRLYFSKTRFRRAATRAIISIFATKMLFLFILELPLEKVLLGDVNVKTLAINLTLPPVVLFLLVNAVNHPSQRNEARVIEYARSILETGTFPTEIFIFSKRPKSKFPSFLGVIYGASLALIIVGTFMFFIKLGFSIFSTFIMIFFLSLVMFFGFLIREQARELAIEEREGILTPIMSFFSLPFIRTGRFLSSQIARFNIVVFLVDVLIEAPFKVFFRIAQQAVHFVREKHEEAVTQVP